MSEKLARNVNKIPEVSSIDIFSEDESREALEALARMKVVLLGVPGAGKTALCQELQSRNPAIEYISLGEISRSLPQGSYERQELDRLFAIGSPVGVPEFFCKLVEPRIDAAVERGDGFILDGIPKKVEETQPFLDFLSSKGLDLDLVVSCELPTLSAYNRVVNRAAREGDPDTIEIFTNRTARYVQDLDSFKTDLTHNNTVPLIVIDTEESNVYEAADQVVDGVQRLIDQRHGVEHNEETFKRLLHEAVSSGNKQAIIKLIGSDFDDILPDFPHEMLSREDLGPEEIRILIQEALAANDPSLRETPYFLRRMAENYLNTTFASLEHLSASLMEESGARFGANYTVDDVYAILRQQFGLKSVIESLQAEVVGNKNLADLLSEEMEVNQSELNHLQGKIAERARLMGIDPSDVTVSELMSLQPRLWQLLTSNQILFSPDYNYRQASNGVPGSHHSLLPFYEE